MASLAQMQTLTDIHTTDLSPDTYPFIYLIILQPIFANATYSRNMLVTPDSTLHPTAQRL